MQLCTVYIEQQQPLQRLSCPSVLSFVDVGFFLVVVVVFFFFLSFFVEGLSSEIRARVSEREREKTCPSLSTAPSAVLLYDFTIAVFVLCECAI